MRYAGALPPRAAEETQKDKLRALLPKLHADFGSNQITMTEGRSLLRALGLSDGDVDCVLSTFRFSLSALLDHLCDDRNEDYLELLGPLQSIFRLSDIDNSGDVSLAELPDAFRRYADLSEQWGLPAILDDCSDEAISEFFKGANVDGDDCLSWDEFYRHAKEKISIARKHILVSKLKQPISSNYSEIPSQIAPSTGLGQVMIDEWYIDYWEMNKTDEYSLFKQVLSAWSCDRSSQLAVAEEMLSAFFQRVRDAYFDNPYHNFRHALATLHATFKLVAGAGITLDPPSLFALASSAICHDIGHRGFNNAFEVMSRSDYALRYNDKSPLENHHCAQAFEIALRGNGQANIFQMFEDGTYNHIRRHMVSGILATDMAHHNELVNSVKNMDCLPDDSLELVNIFLHAGDISNAVMDPRNWWKWGTLVQAEFTQQVAQERNLGLPVSGFMDGLTDRIKSSKSQIGFIDFVIAPFFQPLFTLSLGLDVPKQNLSHNRQAHVKALSKRYWSKSRTSITMSQSDPRLSLLPKSESLSSPKLP